MQNEDSTPANVLIVHILKETFEQNRNIVTDPNSLGNIWLMLASIIPFIDDHRMTRLLPAGSDLPDQSNLQPTHIVRARHPARNEPLR